MKRIFIFLLIAAGLAHIASAASWVEFGQSLDGKTTGYVDVDSMQVRSEPASVWIKYVAEAGNYGMHHTQFRRDTRQYRFLKIVTYGKDGNVIDSSDYGESSLWRDIPPGSLVEILYEVVYPPGKP